MDEREAFQLLTLASARDGRTVSQATARVWANDLAYIALLDAVEAATRHYRASDRWLMPSHIIDGVRGIRAEQAREARRHRAITFTPTPKGPGKPANFDELVAEAAAQHRKENDDIPNDDL